MPLAAVYQLPAWEVKSWMEYEQAEPFGVWRDNWHMAMLAAIQANAYRDPKKRPYRIDEFMWTDPGKARKAKDAATIAFLERKADG